MDFSHKFLSSKRLSIKIRYILIDFASPENSSNTILEIVCVQKYPPFWGKNW